jgi:hypothetical protein
VGTEVVKECIKRMEEVCMCERCTVGMQDAREGGTFGLVSAFESNLWRWQLQRPGHPMAPGQQPTGAIYIYIYI